MKLRAIVAALLFACGLAAPAWAGSSTVSVPGCSSGCLTFGTTTDGVSSNYGAVSIVDGAAAANKATVKNSNTAPTTSDFPLVVAPSPVSLFPSYTVPSSSSAVGIAPGASTALEASHVIKASAGNLYSLQVETTTVGGCLMVFNATSAPADGAVTPALAPLPVGANSFASVSFSPGPAAYLGTGIVAVFSSTCGFTKTASATAFFSWQAQ